MQSFLQEYRSRTTAVFGLFLLLLYAGKVRAQSCTANAGGNATVCGSTTTLTGTVSGTLGTLNSPLWTFVSGPATPTIASPNSLNTIIIGMTVDGNYTFRLTRTCSTGTAVSDVTITAHPRPATFTAGSDITNICATTGTTPLAGVIPAGFTGSWQAVNIYSRNKYGVTVSDNAQFSNNTIATPDFSLINKSNHDIDPAYYVILTITSVDGICSYKDTTIVRFPPNPQINPPLNISQCTDINGANYFYLNSAPYFSTGTVGSAGTAANGTTFTMNVISQPSGGVLSLGILDNNIVGLNGVNVPGAYKFTLTVTNSCGTYTTPTITYNNLGSVPHQVNFQPTGHTAPEQLLTYYTQGSGGEVHCNLAGTTTPETFYFSINPLDSSTVITSVSNGGTPPPGGVPTISFTGAGTYNRTVTVTPPSGGWRAGTYKINVNTYASTGSCSIVQEYYIHVSDQSRPKVVVPDISVCYPGTGAISATIPLPAVYKGVVNSSYFQEFVGQYNFTVVSKPAGSGTPSYTATNLRSLTNVSTTISNLTMAGDYVFRIIAAPYASYVGDFLGQEYACSGTSMVDTFVVHVENPINANAGSDQTLNCASSLTLLGNNQGSGVGLWTKVSSPAGSSPVIGSTSAANTTVTGVDANGTYTYAWSITSQYGGCASSDTVNFAVTNVAPATPATTVTNYLCSGTAGSIVVNSPTGAAYEYSINGTAWQTSPTFNGLAGGIYPVSVRFAGSSTCITTRNDTVRLSVCGSVFNDANRNTRLDPSESFASIPAPMYVYLVNSGNVVVDSATVAANGTYTLKASHNQNYSIELSTQRYPIGTNVITTPINNTPPARYATTGENRSGNNTGTGDGIADGVLSNLTVLTTRLINMNFGITCATAGTSASTPICANESSVMPLDAFITGEDPGGTWTYATGSGITFNAGAGTIQLTSTATNSTFQYAFPAASGCAASSSIATVTVRPIPVNTRNITICQGDSVCVVNAQGGSLVLGANQRTCHYTTGTYYDTLAGGAVGGCDSIVITNLTVNVCTVNISGSVFNDANGNTVINASETLSSLPAPLYVYLVNSSNVVIDSAHVAADGSYTLQGPPSQNYTLELSTTQYAPGINVTTTPIGNTPPSGWVTTGENGANNTGSGDGTPNGVLPITVGASNFTNANFGIEQPPTAVNDASNNNTYGSAVTVNVVSNDTDPTPGTVDATRVSMIAPGGATGITTDGAGDVVSMTIPNQGTWAVNATTGAMTFTPQLGYIGNPTPVSYTVRDNANVISPSATVTITYNAPIQVTGSVFNDANGNKLIDGSETFASLPVPLYVYLVNSSNVVIDSARVAANGSYALQAPPSQNYTLELSTTQYPLGTNVITTPIVNTPPTNWVTTGENGNNNTGSGDGTPNGVLAVTVTTSNVANQNFGIEERPTAGSGQASMVNQNGTVQHTVSNTAFTSTANSSDVTPGNVASIRITAFPTGATSIVINGTTYTSAGGGGTTAWPGGGVTVPTDINGNPAQTISVDPTANDATQVTIPYVAVDNAGVESLSGGSAVVNFIRDPVRSGDNLIAGTVFNDYDGATNGINNLSGITVSGLNAVLVGSDGLGGQVVYGTSPVSNIDGSYQFINVPTGNYSVYITTLNPAPRDPAPAVVLPSGWGSTGEYWGTGTSNDGTANGILPVTVTGPQEDVVDVNFGIQRPPTATAKNFSVGGTEFSTAPPSGYPVVTNFVSIPSSSAALTGYNGSGGRLSGTDPDDCPGASDCNSGKTFTIGTINTNTRLYYNFGAGAVLVTPNTVITNYDPTRLVIYGQKGSGLGSPVGFTYSITDAAGKVSPLVTYAITSSTPLSVDVIEFNARKAGQTVVLDWITTSEVNLKGFGVEKSRDGKTWIVLSMVDSKGKTSTTTQEYVEVDKAPYNGINYYRLKSLDVNGSYAYSQTRTVTFAKAGLVLAPNPVTDVLTITGLDAGAEIRILTAHGALVKAQKATGVLETISMNELASGCYFIVIRSDDGELKQYKVFKN